MKNDSLVFGTTDGPLPPAPQWGRKWVVGADSSHTELSVIVWLCVTSTPQWQQPLINPTSPHHALPIGGFSPKLFLILTFLSVCLFVCVCSSWGYFQFPNPPQGCIQNFYSSKKAPKLISLLIVHHMHHDKLWQYQIIWLLEKWNISSLNKSAAAEI